MKLLAAILFMSISVSAQWQGGIAYQAKSSVPENGAAIYAIRKLPYQSPSLGINLKGKVSYFYSNENVFLNRASTELDYHEYAGDFLLEINFFPSPVFIPYTALGLGAGHITSDNYDKTYFSLSAQGGIKFFTNLQPFIELHLRQTFADYGGNEEVSIRNFQVAGAIGILFNL
jgi:hypothetical protein